MDKFEPVTVATYYVIDDIGCKGEIAHNIIQHLVPPFTPKIEVLELLGKQYARKLQEASKNGNI